MRSGTSCVFSAEFLPFLYLETMLWAANITNHGNTEYVCVQIYWLGWFGRKKKTTKKEKIEESTPVFLTVQFPKGRKESVPALVQGTDPWDPSNAKRIRFRWRIRIDPIIGCCQY